MRALLLAAGLGTRLRPLTETVPKCLVPIAGRPLLTHWLDALFADPRIERVLINTHHLADQVTAVVGSLPWRHRIDLVHEPSLLGTGGTVLANRAWLGGGPVFVAHADNLTDAPVSHIIDPHLAARKSVAMTMLAFRTPTPGTCGILELDARARVVGFHEKVANPPGIWRMGRFTSSNRKSWIGSRRSAGRSWICRPTSSRRFCPASWPSNTAAFSWISATTKRLPGRARTFRHWTHLGPELEPVG